MFHRLTARKTLYQAFERVRDNGGCRGCDGITLGRFTAELEWQLDAIQSSLMARRYHPLPLLRFSVPKPRGGVRHLSVPTVRDRVVQSAAYLVTQGTFEAEFEDMSFAYRPGRSVRDAIARIKELRDAGYRWVVDADVDAFFDNIPHTPLLARLERLPLDPYLRRLFELWVRAEVYDGRRLYRLDRGVPQGSVTSPALANLFLDQLDENLAHFGQVAVRYGDDFCVLCKDPSETAEALEITDLLLEELELDLNREKTAVTSFDQGFKFLGAIFVGDDIFLPFDRPKKRRGEPALPPPLDLLTYLELKHNAIEGES